MQILTKQNIVIDYCEDGYISMGATVVCPTTQKTFENCTVVTVDSVPTDIEAYMYMYANGKFYRNDLVLREYVKLKLDKKADSTHKHSAVDITSGTLPVVRGGTEATTPAAARVNLGFTYGTEEPSGTPSTGEGSVYFMEDDGSPLPVSEGGTNAVTAQEALVNLGVADYIVEQGTTEAWSWEKYANGKIHCAMKVSTEYNASESSGSLYYQDYDISIPDAVPVLTGTINNVIIMPQAGNGLSFFMGKGINGRTISYRYVNSASVYHNQLTVIYQFDGKWK